MSRLLPLIVLLACTRDPSTPETGSDSGTGTDSDPEIGGTDIQVIDGFSKMIDWMEPGDLDGDGDLDLLVGSGGLWALYWDSAGFLEPQLLEADGAPIFLGAAIGEAELVLEVLGVEMQGDNEVDWVELWTAHIEGSTVSLGEQLASQLSFTDVAIADVDDDGSPEAYYTKPEGALRLIRSDGSSESIGVLGSPAELALLDHEVFVRHWEEGGWGEADVGFVSRLADAGGGLSVVTSTETHPYEGHWGRMAVGDFDEDGDHDALTTAQNVIYPHWTGPDGALDFAGALSGPVPMDAGVVAADLDGDGNDEAVYVDADSRLLALEGASLTPRADFDVALPAKSWVTTLAVADFDRDGRDDVAAGTSGGPNVSPVPPQVIVTFSRP